MSKSIHFSIIAPLYNEEELCVELCYRIAKMMKLIGEAFEIIFVDDGVVHKYNPILSPLQELNKLPIKELIE